MKVGENKNDNRKEGGIIKSKQITTKKKKTRNKKNFVFYIFLQKLSTQSLYDILVFRLI